MMTTRRQTPLRIVPMHGFTLVELVCVVVIIGMFAAIAVPRLGNSIALHRVESAARRIIVDLALAQRQARSANNNQTVAFKPNDDLYELAGIPDPDHPSQNYAVSLQEEPYNATIISADFGGDNDIVYDVFGVPDSGGSIVIGVGSRVRTIVVDADTGKASVP